MNELIVLFVVFAFLLIVVLASINYKMGRIAKALERLAEIEFPVLTAAVSEISQSIDDVVTSLQSPMIVIGKAAHRGQNSTN